MIITTRKGKQKHIKYDGTLSPLLAQITQAMIQSSMARLIKSATKSNTLLAWVLEGELVRLHEYYDISINLDILLDYQPEERIYRG